MYEALALRVVVGIAVLAALCVGLLSSLLSGSGGVGGVGIGVFKVVGIVASCSDPSWQIVRDLQASLQEFVGLDIFVGEVVVILDYLPLELVGPAIPELVVVSDVEQSLCWDPFLDV